MKTKFIASIAGVLLLSLAAFTAPAQQPPALKAPNAGRPMTGINSAPAYSYRVFEAPNKMFGYDIFLNGKIIYHETASPGQPAMAAGALAKKEQADKAASMAIGKIRRGEPAALTQEEIKKVTGQ
jgi:hypothetical protein